MKKFFEIIKQNKIDIMLIISIYACLLIGSILNLNGRIYYCLCFTLYSFINTIRNKNSSFVIYIAWSLFILIYKIVDIDLILITLTMNIFGFIVGKLYLKLMGIKLKQNDSLNKVLSILYPMFLIITLESFYMICNGLSINIRIMILPVVIVYIIWVFLLSLFGSSKIANIIISIVFVVLYFANQIRLYFTGVPLSFNDFVLINQTGEILEIVKDSFFDAIINYKKQLIILFINIVCIFLICNKNKVKVKKLYLRVIIIIILSIAMHTIIFPKQSLNKSILKKFYSSSEITSLASLKKYYEVYSVLGGGYGKYLASIDYSYKIKNAKELNKIYDVKYENTDKIFKKPNVIVMFTEAFWDITKQQDYLFDVDPLKEYHALREKGIVISTLSPSFGGSSSNTEFEFLTGGNMSGISDGSFAYQKYYNSLFNKLKSTSIINELHNNGYTTEILNAYTSSLYNCDHIYDIMGVDKQTHLMDELGHSPKDSYLGDKIIEKFKNKKVDEKAFYMTISMESHMPYNARDYDTYDFNILNKENRENREYIGMIKAYTQSIRNASLQLERVYNFIQTIDEDTIIVFFGDHLPYLRRDFFSAYDNMKYFNTDDELLNLFRKYNTETLILSNYDIKYNDLKTMSNDMISTMILNNMDIEISDYYKWLYTTRRILPAANTLISLDTDGNIYDNNKLPKEMADVMLLRKQVQQFVFH